MHQEIIKRAEEIIAANCSQSAPDHPSPYCVLAQQDLDGQITAAAVTAANADGIRVLHFDTGLQSSKALRVAKNPSACVCFASGEYNISLVGTIEVITDAKVKQDCWYPGMAHHFSGPDDPNYCVLRFTTQRYNLFVGWKEAKGAIE